MYQTLTYLHSLVRWAVLISLAYAVYRAYKGYRSGAPFTKTDNAVRHWTATILHIQLVIGMVLYFRSPVAGNFREAVLERDTVFFGLIHPLLMLAAIVVITIGSALSKRRTAAGSKFKTMLLWFAAALILVLIAIPWPFSPLAPRPYFR